jgi:hypothetical protein
MTTWTPTEFAEHLASSGKRLHPQMTRVVNRGAMNIQADWRQRAARLNPPGSASAGYAKTIVKRRGKFTRGSYYIEVEAVGGQGLLGAILEYGGPHNAPQRSNVAAANKEAPELRKWMAKIAAEVI